MQIGDSTNKPGPTSGPGPAAAPAAKPVPKPTSGFSLSPDRFFHQALVAVESAAGKAESALKDVALRAATPESWLVSKVRTALGPAPADATHPLDRARATWTAIERQMGGTAKPGVFLDHPDNPFILADAWPQGQGIGAALDIAKQTGDYRKVDETMGALARYREGHAYAPGIDPSGHSTRYFDDNAWLGLDFMQALSQTGDKQYLKKAEDLFPFIEQGLSKDGGEYWVEKSDRMSRNTCSNGPAIEFALRLYQQTHDPKYLKFAENSERFMNAKLRSSDPGTKGLYWDNLGDDGSLSKAIYSYNQGTPVGADLLFYRVTGDKQYLDRAQQTANAALDYFSKDDRLWKESPAFNAIFFRNLLALDAVAPDPRIRTALDGYLDRAWKQARDPKTGLFDQGGIGHYGSPGNYLDQAGMAQLYALQSWPKDQLSEVG